MTITKGGVSKALRQAGKKVFLIVVVQKVRLKGRMKSGDGFSGEGVVIGEKVGGKPESGIGSHGDLKVKKELAKIEGRGDSFNNGGSSKEENGPNKRSER